MSPGPLFAACHHAADFHLASSTIEATESRVQIRWQIAAIIPATAKNNILGH
jgi:hypothetical protein